MPRFVIQYRGEPPGEQANVVLVQCLDLGVKGRNVFRAIIVGECFEAEPFEHCGPFFGSAFLCVERDDAPGVQIVASEDSSPAGRGTESPAAAADC